MLRVCHAFLSVHCSLVVICSERDDFLALLYVMFSCVFVTIPCGVLGQEWYLIVSIPDLCLPIYFYLNRCKKRLNARLSYAFDLFFSAHFIKSILH